MLKIYSFIITILCVSAPVVMYYFISDTVEQEINNKKSEISQIKAELEQTRKVLNSSMAEVDKLKDENSKTAENLGAKSETIKTLEDDFKKLLSSRNSEKLVTEEAVCPTCQVCPVYEECEEAKTTANSCVATGINDKIEYDALSYLYLRQVWTNTMPYVKWSEIPDLHTLYLTTENKDIKNIIPYACPKAYYSEWINNREKIVTSMLKWYCNNKIERCSEEVRNKIETIKNDTSRLPSVWLQFITRYIDNNPSDYTERALVYYNEYWNRICAWKEVITRKWNVMLIRLN